MTNTTHPLYVTNADGVKEAIIVPVDEYQALLEDLDDMAVIAERRDESMISHDQLLEDLRSNGQL